MSLNKADSPHDSTGPCATKQFTGPGDLGSRLITRRITVPPACLRARALIGLPHHRSYTRPSTSIPSFLTAQLLEVAAGDSTSGLRVDRSAYLFCGASVLYTNIVVWKTPVANIGTSLPYLSCKLLYINKFFKHCHMQGFINREISKLSFLRGVRGGNCYIDNYMKEVKKMKMYKKNKETHHWTI